MWNWKESEIEGKFDTSGCFNENFQRDPELKSLILVRMIHYCMEITEIILNLIWLVSEILSFVHVKIPFSANKTKCSANKSYDNKNYGEHCQAFITVVKTKPAK